MSALVTLTSVSTCAAASADIMPDATLSDIKQTIEAMRPWMQEKEPSFYRAVFLATTEVRNLCENEFNVQQRLNADSSTAEFRSSMVRVKYIAPEKAHQRLQDEAADEALRKTISNKLNEIIDRKVSPILPPQALVDFTLAGAKDSHFITTSPVREVAALHLHDRAHLIQHTQDFFVELKRAVSAPTADFAKCMQLIDSVSLGVK